MGPGAGRTVDADSRGAPTRPPRSASPCPSDTASPELLRANASEGPCPRAPAPGAPASASRPPQISCGHSCATVRSRPTSSPPRPAAGREGAAHAGWAAVVPSSTARGAPLPRKAWKTPMAPAQMAAGSRSRPRPILPRSAPAAGPSSQGCATLQATSYR